MQFLIYRVLLLPTKNGACSSNKSGVVGPEQTSDSKTLSAASDKYRATQHTVAQTGTVTVTK